MVICLSLCRKRSKEGWMSLNLAANVLICDLISGFNFNMIQVIQLGTKSKQASAVILLCNSSNMST